MEKLVYGFKFVITPENVEVSKLMGNFATETTKAFCRIKRHGTFHSFVFDVLVNEAVRKRLNPDDEEAINTVNEIVLNIEKHGMSTKDIIILRSCYFTFEDILQYAKQKKTVAKVLEEEGIDNPEIEAVYGVTALNMKNAYVSYNVAKEV